MKVSEFEYRHQTLVHQFLVAAAFLTYLIDRDNVIWRFVKYSATPRDLERSLFLVATFFIAFGAGICTWARVYRRPKGTTGERLCARHLGDFSYAIGLGSLAPLSGFVILVVGEALRVLRLTRLRNHCAKEVDTGWRQAFRQEAVKWGLLLTMVVFVVTLRDRLAEVLATVSFLVALLLNAPIFSSIKSPRV